MPKQNVRSEILIGGSWVDVTSRTEGAEKVSITAGSGAETSYLTSGSCRFTINNRDGVFSSDNPNSTYYGKIGRNVQFRTGLIQAKYVRMTGTYDSTGAYDNAHIGTPDRAALDITGDIDIRADIAPEDWRGSEPQHIASKYQTAAPQRSWYFFVDEFGQLGFTWSPDGTNANLKGARSLTLPTSSQGRLSVRVTLDVDNGAGGWTLTFYTSDSITGTWTQISQTVTTSGTTSIFASTTPLNMGTLENGSVSGWVPFVGKIYGMELRDGIGGTLVAKLDASIAARGASSLADGVSGTWFCSGSARIDDMDYRFWGEVNKLPQRWDETGTDVYVPVLAQDILSRLMNGARSLDSAIYRNLAQYADSSIPTTGAAAQWFTGWWPMEADSGGSLSAVKGTTGNYSLADVSAWSGLPGTAAGLQFSDDLGTASGSAQPVSTYYGNGGLGAMGSTFYFQLPSVPVADRVIMTWRMRTGDLTRITLTVGTALYTLSAYGPDGVLIGSTAVAFGALPTLPTAMGFVVTEDGTGLFHVFWRWYPADGSTVFSIDDLWNNAGYSKLRQVSAWTSPGFTGKNGMRLGHVTLNQGTLIDFTTYNFVSSTNAYVGEPALSRFERLCGQEGVQYYTRGLSATSPAMGAQTPDTLLNLVKECSEVVGGLIYAPRDKFGVTLRTLAGMAGRSAWAPVIDYAAGQISPDLEPERISTGIKNAVTASRPGGGSRRRVKTAGALNVNDPSIDPQGAGRYDVPITRNVGADYWLQSQADWEVAVSTDDANRYSAITLQLDRPEFSATLVDRFASVALGDVLILRNLPIWMGSGDVELITRGYTEVVDNFTREITYNAAPYGPYRWGIIYYPGQSARFDSTTTTLAAGITSGATSARFALGTEQTRWSQAAVPYDVKISGQRNTVTEVGAKGAVGTDLGGFEVSAANWQGGTGAPVRSTTRAKHGTASGLVTVSGSPVSFTVRPTSSSVMALITPGATYTLSVWVYPSIALTSNFGGGITWYLGASSVSTSTATAITAPANTWTQLTFTATAPGSGVDRASYGPTITGSPANGTLVYFDAIELIGTDVTFQPVTMTRGVDGVTKALSAGDQVRIFDSMTWGRV